MRAQISAIWMTVIATTGFSVQPLLLAAAVAEIGLAARQVGLLAGGAVSGFGIGSALKTLLVCRVAWRRLVASA